MVLGFFSAFPLWPGSSLSLSSVFRAIKTNLIIIFFRHMAPLSSPADLFCLFFLSRHGQMWICPFFRSFMCVPLDYSLFFPDNVYIAIVFGFHIFFSRCCRCSEHHSNMWTYGKLFIITYAFYVLCKNNAITCISHVSIC